MSHLEAYFLHFFTAKDIESAWEVVQSTPVDILLIDINLPRKKSIEFVKSMRKKDPCMPIIILSQCTKTDYLLTLIELKLELYILKPWTQKKRYTLLHKLQEHYAAQHIKELIEGVYIDSDTMSIRFKDSEYPLSSKEMHFLETLWSKHFVSYDEISQLWEAQIPSEDAMRSFIKNLRKKLPKGILKNRQNLGYFF
jgi:DNA-binding response OmpR family regulator